MFPTLVWGHGQDITQDPFMMSYTEIHSLYTHLAKEKKLERKELQ